MSTDDGALAEAADAVQQTGGGSAKGVCVSCCQNKIKGIDDQTQKIASSRSTTSIRGRSKK